MKHARPDYQDRFQDAAGIIPRDEPVMLFRGQDICAPVALMAYALAVESRSGDINIINAVRAQADEMIEWQHEYFKKMPDMPAPGEAPAALPTLKSLTFELVTYIGDRLRDAKSEAGGGFAAMEQMDAEELQAIYDALTRTPDVGACDGCGSIESVEAVRARHPGALSCCPERKMLSAAEWMARARSAEKSLAEVSDRCIAAEAALRATPAEQWPKVVDELVMVLVVHDSYRFAAPADRCEWAAWYPACWISHNGGGWTYTGLSGKVTHVRAMPAMPDHREIMEQI